MKREIKFRVWDIEKKCFIPDSAWALLVNNQAFGVMMIDWENYREGEYFYDNAQILMQFTGLQDKNGKDIYEGDILKVEWQKDSIRSYLQMSDSYTEYKEIVFVSYLKLSFVFILNNGKYFNLPKSCTITIIGNIYENPELLNTTENE